MGFRIEDLQNASLPLGGSEVLELEQAGNSRKVTLADLLPGFDGDTLTASLMDDEDPMKAAGQVAFNAELEYPAGTVGAALKLMPAYPDRAAVEAAIIPAEVTSIQVMAYHPGGLGGARYTRFELETEAQAVVDRINAVSTPDLSKATEWAINNAVRRLKGAGLLAVGKLGALLDLGGAGQAGQAAALVDWIRPTVVTPTLAGSGTTVYTPGKGLQFSGASYVTLGVGFDSLPGVALNAAHAGVFITGSGADDRTQTNDNPMIGGGSRLGLRPNNNAGAITALINTNTAVAIGRQVVGRAGHTIATRISSTAVVGYRDGEMVGETSSASQSVSASHPAIGWWSTPNLFSTDTASFAHFGGALTAADAAVLYDILVEYRHLIQSGANPGALLQSDDGAWWELGYGFVRTPYHYGADEVDDTQAFRDLCSVQRKAWIPIPKSFFKVQDEVVVLARVKGDWSRVRMQIVTPYSRGFDVRDKAKLVGVKIDHEVITATAPAEGGQHCAVLLGRFHGFMAPVRDVDIDVAINALSPMPAGVYVIGNVKDPTIKYHVSGRHINGAAFLAHWGTQIDPDNVTEHSIQRPRGGRIVRGVGKSTVTSGHRGFYYSGVVDWHVDHMEAHNFTAPFGIAPGDKTADFDDDAFNETRQKLLSNLTFDKVILENPAGTACQMWGRTAFIDGKRWYSTDLDSCSSITINSLLIRRGANSIGTGDDGIMVDIDMGANIDIPNLQVTNAPGLSSAVTDVLSPTVRVNGGRNVNIAGRIVGRVGTHLLSGDNVTVNIAAEHQSLAVETSDQSVGVKLIATVPTGTVVNAISAGDTSMVLLASPDCHIVPGMMFDYGGARFMFASSLAGANLTDANVTVKIYPAPIAIPASGVITVLGGLSNFKLLGSEKGYYRNHWYSSADSRIPNNGYIEIDSKYSADDGVQIDGGGGYDFNGGVIDFSNRRNAADTQDIEINANARDVHMHGIRLSPSPSRLATNHILANAACSGIIARDNYGYGSTGTKFSIPATGADGVANVNANYEAP